MCRISCGLVALLADHPTGSVPPYDLLHLPDSDKLQVTRDCVLQAGGGDGEFQRALIIATEGVQPVDHPADKRIAGAHPIDDMCDVIGGAAEKLPVVP